ncbi:MAG: prolipoprotein diacylglyceryl transferase, partial [Candidatus Moranbacteria bacterium]|nr:prolipoprotein diacylglyceryl transferase [Candidatus Moranbacteria bacterium]
MYQWQHILEQLHPIAFTVGFFALHWYAVLWLVGFGAALFFGLWLVRRERTVHESTADLFFVLFVGALICGRLVYVFFYRQVIFLVDPLRIFIPF